MTDSEPNFCLVQTLLGEMSESQVLANLQKDGLFLSKISNPTEEMCLAAVRQNGMALKYVPVQTEQICIVAYKQNPDSIMFSQYSLELLIEYVKSTLVRNNTLRPGVTTQDTGQGSQCNTEYMQPVAHSPVQSTTHSPVQSTAHSSAQSTAHFLREVQQQLPPQPKRLDTSAFLNIVDRYKQTSVWKTVQQLSDSELTIILVHMLVERPQVFQAMREMPDSFSNLLAKTAGLPLDISSYYFNS